jgi:hypothetical protein
MVLKLIDKVGTADAPKPEPAGDQVSTTQENTGVLVLLKPGPGVSAPSLAELASELHLKPGDIENLLAVGKSVPVARALTQEQAVRLSERLNALGRSTSVLAEAGLRLEVPVNKLRALEIADDGLTTTLSSGGRSKIDWSELTLMIVGRLQSSRVEVEERRRRGRSKPIDSRELFSDEPVCDLYTAAEHAGYRIQPGNFDFSCLGSGKAMTAFENFTRLLTLLRSRAPAVQFDDTYRALKTVLGNVWPLDPVTRKGEWRRSGAGKVDVSTVTTIDNEGQFNKYSRFCHRLRSGQLEGDQ